MGKSSTKHRGDLGLSCVCKKINSTINLICQGYANSSPISHTMICIPRYWQFPQRSRPPALEGEVAGASTGEPLNITGAVGPVENPLLSRRDLLRTGGVALIGVSVGTAFKCGSEQVSIYVRTIITFLNQISGSLPQYAATITKIVKIASDFDAAYRRGDFASADSLFNSLEQNLIMMVHDIGINVSNNVKTWISIIGATVTSIAVLFKDQADNLPPALRAQIRTAQSVGAVERLASQKAVDKLYQTAKPSLVIVE